MKEIFFLWRNFDRIKSINTWDYQWVYTVMKNRGLAIIPEQNLIKNIGFTEGATHTNNNSDSVLGQMKLSTLTEINHPKAVKICRDADKYTFNFFSALSESIFIRALKRIKK